MSRESISSLNVTVSFIPDESKPPVKQDKKRIESTMNLNDFFYQMSMFFQIPEEEQPLYCLCIAENDVVVTGFKILGKYLHASKTRNFSNLPAKWVKNCQDSWGRLQNGPRPPVDCLGLQDRRRVFET